MIGEDFVLDRSDGGIGRKSLGGLETSRLRFSVDNESTTVRLGEFNSLEDGEQHPPNLANDGGRKWRRCQLTKASSCFFQNFFNLNRRHLVVIRRRDCG
ncbi:hypothetical protein ACE6H2_026524 [Prunus campanulata]